MSAIVAKAVGMVWTVQGGWEVPGRGSRWDKDLLVLDSIPLEQIPYWLARSPHDLVPAMDLAAPICWSSYLIDVASVECHTLWIDPDVVHRYLQKRLELGI